MAEYTTSSQAYREYMSARERTAYWVQSNMPRDSGFYSPSVPPFALDGQFPSRPPSEAGSSHSTPPKMVLRYNDGRPDIPIPHPKGSLSRSGSSRRQDPSLGRSRTLSYNHGMAHGHARSGSSGAPTPSPLRHDDLVPPEEIRILPSSGKSPTAISSRPSHTRSRSVPRGVDRDFDEPDLPFIPPSHLQSASPYRPSRSPSHHQVSFAPPAQPSQPWHRSKQSPAAYAPHHPQRPGYPAMLHHPPHVGPNGVIYSHSAPLPGHGQYPPHFVTPFPTVGEPSRQHAASLHENRGREFTRSLGQSARPAHLRAGPDSAESLESDQSGTYYVQSNGQKVHVISPSPERSIVTATSTTKSPTSPHYGKKPFFQRLFSKFSTSGSSRTGGRKLSRRHSIGHRVE